jgi:predicted methyltransferase
MPPSSRTASTLISYCLLAGLLPALAQCGPAASRPPPATAPESGPLEPAEGTPRVHESPQGPSSNEAQPTRHLLEFLGIGPGERIADLGAGTGYSIEQMADKVGASGLVYTRHDPRILIAAAAPGAAAEREGALPENVVVMSTPDAAPFSGEAKHLDLVTMLFAYHDLVARGRDRLAFNRAVFNALSPDRFYVIAEHAAPSGAGVGAAREGRIEERLVRADVEAAGFVFVEAAQLLPSTASQRSSPQAASSQYLLKFRRPR